MRVALFATCFNDTMWPQTPRATVLLLERLGVEVEFPVEQTCCGQMFTNTGYAQEAIPGVRQFVAVFGGYDAVVAPSGSCVGSVRHQHAGIADRAADPGLRAAVEAITPKVFELSEFLVDVLQVTDVGAYSRTGSPITRRATRCGCCTSAISRCGYCAGYAGSTLSSCPRPTNAADSVAPSR